MPHKTRAKAPRSDAAAQTSRRPKPTGPLDTSPRVTAQLARQRAMFGDALTATPQVLQRFVVPGRDATKKRMTYASSYAPGVSYGTQEEADKADREHEAAAHADKSSTGDGGTDAAAPAASSSGASSAPPPHSATVQRPVPVRAPRVARAPRARPQTPQERGYPLGFRSLEEFRDATRPAARAYRDSTILVRGSSVTGRSGDGKRPFRDRTYAHPRSRRGRSLGKARTRSDIDVGIVRPNTVGRGDIDWRGFPKRGSAAADTERAHSDAVEGAIQHPTGLKFFDNHPGGPVIERPHTPVEDRSAEEREALGLHLGPALEHLAAERAAGDGAAEDGKSKEEE